MKKTALAKVLSKIGTTAAKKLPAPHHSSVITRQKSRLTLKRLVSNPS